MAVAPPYEWTPKYPGEPNPWDQRKLEDNRKLANRLSRRLRLARESYLRDCAELAVEPKFSHGRGVITPEMSAKMDCPLPPGDDL